MSPRLCILITSDPRLSPRPAEAVRIAAALCAGRRVDVTVYLHGPAIRALHECVEGLVDDENFERYWPILGEMNRPVCVQRHAPELAALNEPRLPFRETGLDELAQLLRDSTYVLRF